jgi:hypothetical protein
MTVSELIAELQKFPGHHRVFIEFPDRGEPRLSGGYATEIASVADVRGDGCAAVIDATGGVQ